MTTKTDEQERESFEKFMSDDGKFPQAIERDANGNYVLMQAASSWHVWKARAALQSQDREDASSEYIRHAVLSVPAKYFSDDGRSRESNRVIAASAAVEAAIDHARRRHGALGLEE